MGLLTSNEQGRPFLLNHSIYSKHRHPPLLSRSQETLEVCLSQGSSYESHTGGLDSRNPPNTTKSKPQSRARASSMNRPYWHCRKYETTLI